MPHAWATSLALSTSTLAKIMEGDEACWVARRSKMGEMALQGPHQMAWKSMMRRELALSLLNCERDLISCILGLGNSEEEDEEVVVVVRSLSRRDGGEIKGMRPAG